MLQLSCGVGGDLGVQDVVLSQDGAMAEWWPGETQGGWGRGVAAGVPRAAHCVQWCRLHHYKRVRAAKSRPDSSPHKAAID